MATHLPCPFCKTSPSVGFFYKHLVGSHLKQLFDDKTDYGKANLNWLTKDRPAPFTLNLPKGEVKYCCSSCQVAVNKMYWAQKHFKCSEACHQKNKEMKMLLEITPTDAPFADELPIAKTQIEPLPSDKETLYCKIICNLINEINLVKDQAFYYNKLVEDNDINEHWKRLADDEDVEKERKRDEYDFYDENRNEMKMLGMKFEDIKRLSRMKLAKN